MTERLGSDGIKYKAVVGESKLVQVAESAKYTDSIFTLISDEDFVYVSRAQSLCVKNSKRVT